MRGRRPALGPTVDEERATTVEGVQKRLVHRLPWLGIGLLGAMVSAWMVGAAEEELSRTVTVAFFLPAIVYMADAVGTQTEVLAVRGLPAVCPRAVRGLVVGNCGIGRVTGEFDGRKCRCIGAAMDSQRSRQGSCIRIRTDFDGDSGPVVDCDLSHSRDPDCVMHN